MNKICILIAISLFCCFELLGQTHTTLRTERPGKTMGTFAVGKYVLQTQTGFSFTDTTSDTFERNQLQLTQELRLGLSEIFELQFVSAYRSVNNVYQLGQGIPEEPAGISITQIGFRVNISDGSTFLPMCLQYRLKTRWTDAAFRSQSFGSRLIWAIGYKPIKYVALSANLGIDYDGNDQGPSTLYAFNVRWIPFPRMEFMIEYFGEIGLSENLTDQRWSSNLNFGFAYLLGDNLKVDISSGGLYIEDIDVSYVEIGFSWRTHFFKEKEL